MASFTVGAAEFNRQRPSNFQEFISIAKGRSIVSAADWGADRLELGLSGGVMIRLFTSTPTEVNVIATVNPGELPPLLVEFGDLPQRVPLSVIEDKLRGLRTLHAIYYLADSDRMADLAAYLSSTPVGDIERDLIPEEERLQIESLSYGSWILALWAKTTKAFKAVSSVAGLVFERGADWRQKLDFWRIKQTGRVFRPHGRDLTSGRPKWNTSSTSVIRFRHPKSKSVCVSAL